MLMPLKRGLVVLMGRAGRMGVASSGRVNPDSLDSQTPSTACAGVATGHRPASSTIDVEQMPRRPEALDLHFNRPTERSLSSERRTDNSMKGDVKSAAAFLPRTDLATPFRPAVRHHLAEFHVPSFAFVVPLAAVPSRRCLASNEGAERCAATRTQSPLVWSGKSSLLGLSPGGIERSCCSLMPQLSQDRSPNLARISPKLAGIPANGAPADWPGRPHCF